MEIKDLEEKKLVDLRQIAKTLGIGSVTAFNKSDLIEKIQEQVKENIKNNQEMDEKRIGQEGSEDKLEKSSLKVKNQKTEEPKQDTVEIEGVLDVMADGYGFIRANVYDSGDEDVFVSPTQIRRFRLKTGDYIKGLIRPLKDSEKFAPLIYVLEINGNSPENAYKRKNFEDLKPLYPRTLINLEDDQNSISNRMINLFAPIGKGQRGLIVSPPKTGKTTILKSVAQAIEKNHPEMKIFILLIDERPEEVTDIERSVNKFTDDKSKLMKTEIVSSTFDEPIENHVRLSEIVLERAKRFVENGVDVVILLDSITRMARAYNILTPPSGKTLSGGLDPIALYKPKRFFGAARNIEQGGSLTILATCLVDTGSRLDDMIYEEFKGTGNMELHLDRDLSELRVFPALDIYKSGTRRDDLLLDENTSKLLLKLRQSNKGTRPDQGIQQTIKLIKNSKTNEDFLKIIKNI